MDTQDTTSTPIPYDSKLETKRNFFIFEDVEIVKRNRSGYRRQYNALLGKLRELVFATTSIPSSPERSGGSSVNPGSRLVTEQDDVLQEMKDIISRYEKAVEMSIEQGREFRAYKDTLEAIKILPHYENCAIIEKLSPRADTVKCGPSCVLL
jgi:hypothetical protein